MVFHTTLHLTKELTSHDHRTHSSYCVPSQPQVAGLIEQWNGLLKTVTGGSAGSPEGSACFESAPSVPCLLRGLGEDKFCETVKVKVQANSSRIFSLEPNPEIKERCWFFLIHKLFKNQEFAREWWHTPLSPSLRKQKQADLQGQLDLQS